MKREDVYKIIDGERNYQIKRWEDGLRDRPDVNKDVAEWLIYLEYLLNQAKSEVYHLKQRDALNTIRKITAVGVACLEAKGCDPR